MPLGGLTGLSELTQKAQRLIRRLFHFELSN